METKQLKASRMALGLTQREVAERCGLSTENYARIERGAASTTMATMERIADALELNIVLINKKLSDQ